MMIERKRMEELAAKEAELNKLYVEKLINPFTDIDELRSLFMNPVPRDVGMI
jgi:hypothetical protein